MMAGLYDKCRLNNEDTILYSASVITVSASEPMSWLHHRMPVGIYCTLTKLKSLLFFNENRISGKFHLLTTFIRRLCWRLKKN